jgi:hypothetical protein
MPVIFIFIDGIGIGEVNTSNPFYKNGWKSIDYLTDGQSLTNASKSVYRDDLYYKAVDANLGVDGFPQSGTGQTTLFTGVNASKVLGKHFGPFPHSGIKPLLKNESLFLKANKAGKSTHFINAYPEIFFERSSKTNRWSCTTLMTRSAGQRLNTLSDVLSGDAITAEIMQHAWRDMLGLDVPEILPETAAERLLKSSSKYDLVMYEYYLTDKAGHAKDPEMAKRVFSVFDRFLYHLITNKSSDTHLVISSDHGNMEDLSVKTHTRNPVPLFISGSGSGKIKKAQSIMDVPSIILDLLQND